MSAEIISHRRMSLNNFHRYSRRKKIMLLLGLIVFIALLIWFITWLSWRFGHVTENDAHYQR